MSTQIKLTPGQKQLLETGTVISIDGSRFMLLPYWVEEKANGECFVHSPEKLPQRVQNIIQSMRNGQ